MKRFKLNFGFTLIELLVAMGIIGMLAVFMIASYSRAQAKARDGRRKADLAIIKVSLESYFNDRGMYPEKSEIVFGSPFTYGTETYFKKLPNDPLYPNNKYCYEPRGDLLSYSLGADFETGARGCTAGASTPAPTAAVSSATPLPTSSPVPTGTVAPTPTSTLGPSPAGQCIGGRWFEIGPVGDCVVPNSIGEGQPVGAGCDAWQCGAQINYCHFQDDDNCPHFTDPGSPWYNHGRKYTNCECTLL